MSIIVNNLCQSAASCIGRIVNAPEQRLIQGVTGLPLQTAIDSHNNKTDKETRIASVSRTAGKVIAGTTTGVLIRHAGIQLLKNFTRYKINAKANGYIKEVGPATHFDIFMPRISFKDAEMTTIAFRNMHTNFVKVMGTLLATLIMMVTNFVVDAPLTKYIDRKIKPYVIEWFDKKEAKNDAA